MEDLSGQTIGRYRVAERLGQGGMGEVYKAFDTRLKRFVALKRLPTSLSREPGYRLRFLRGAQHAAKLNHPSLAAVHDFFEKRDELYLVMEYVKGSTLDSLPLPLSVEAFLEIAIQCAEGLEQAHEKGIVHQDLKPRNIMLGSDGKVKVLDFGIARRVAPAEGDTSSMKTAEDECGGTPAYMAPELLLGKPSDQRSDLFSLGVVFYELLTGKHPYPGQTLAIRTDRILHDEPPPVSSLSPESGESLDGVLRRLLCKDPDTRYPSAEELLEDLRAIREQFTGAGRMRGAKSGPRKRQRPTLVLLPFLAVLGFLLFLLWGYIPWGFVGESSRPVTVALLPFSVGDQSKEADSTIAAFYAGLHYSLNRRLRHVRGVRDFNVVPSELIFERKIDSPAKIGLDAGANRAVATRISMVGPDADIQQDLLREGSGRRLRTASAKLPYGEPMAMEAQLLENAVSILDLKLTPQERSRLFRFGTKEEVAYHFYLRGIGWLNESTDSAKCDLAIEAFRSSLAMDNGYARASAGLGQALLCKAAAGEDPVLVEEADQRCRQAARGDPELSEAQFCLAEIASRRHDPEAALERYRAAINLDPQCYECETGLIETLVQSGQREKALQLCRQEALANPTLWLPHYTLGILLYREARYREAAREFDAVTKSAPKYYRAWTNLAASYGVLAEYDLVSSSAERSISLKPAGTAYSNLATAYFYQGRFRESVETFRQAIIYLNRERKLGFTVFGNLADALYWSPGERQKAAPQYRKALEMANRELEGGRAHGAELATLLGRMAFYSAALGENEEAMRSLEMALQASPGDAETLFKAALVHIQFGETETAADWLKRALDAGAPVENARRHPLFTALREDPRYASLFDQDRTGKEGMEKNSVP